MRQHAPEKSNYLSVGTVTLYFAAYFFFIYVYVRPDFLYYAFITDGGYVYPPFLVSWSFLEEFLRHPGGLSYYISSFLFQSYSLPLLGSLVVTALAGAAYWINRVTLRQGYGYSIDLLAFFPAAASVVMIAGYGDPFPLLVNFCIAVGCSYLYIVGAANRFPRHYAAFPLFFAAVYYLAGGGAILFSLLVALFAFQNNKKGFQTLIAVSVSIAAAWLLYRSLDVRAALQYVSMLGTYPENKVFGNDKIFVNGCATAVSSFMLACAALAPLAKSHVLSRIAAVARPLPFLRSLGPAAALAITAGCLLVSRDDGRRTKVEFEYLNRLDRWTDIIALVNKQAPARPDAVALFDLNRALFHTSALGEKMLDYPQYPEAVSLNRATKKYWLPVLVRNAQLYYELGCMNLSKSYLFELFEGSRIEHPYVLELLARVALAQGRPALARRWYARLSKDMIYGRKASEALRRCDDMIRSPATDTLDPIRACTLDRDTVVTVFDLREFCPALLEKNPGNRMAFDYLISTFLLSGDIASFLNYLPGFEKAGYGRLPLHWAEAIVLAVGMNAAPDPRLLALVPSGVQSRFKEFMEDFLSIRRKCGDSGEGNEQFKMRASEGLRGRFGATYFFYYFFRQCGEPKWYR